MQGDEISAFAAARQGQLVSFSTEYRPISVSAYVTW